MVMQITWYLALLIKVALAIPLMQGPDAASQRVGVSDGFS